MGLNMPARTVLFAELSKFDGTAFRYLSSGEYIQMSGRAGRRGLDSKGVVVQMVDDRTDTAKVREMLTGAADTLSSRFHLSYNMLLNCVRVETVDVEMLIRKSFCTPWRLYPRTRMHLHSSVGAFEQASMPSPLSLRTMPRQALPPPLRMAYLPCTLKECWSNSRDSADTFQQQKSLPQMKAQHKQYLDRLTTAAELAVPQLELVTELHALLHTEASVKDELRTIVNAPTYSLPFLQAGRLAQVRTATVIHAPSWAAASHRRRDGAASLAAHAPRLAAAWHTLLASKTCHPDPFPHSSVALAPTHAGAPASATLRCLRGRRPPRHGLELGRHRRVQK